MAFKYDLHLKCRGAIYRLSKYFGSLIWLLRIILCQNQKKAILFVLSKFSGLACIGLGFGSLILYLNSLEQNQDNITLLSDINITEIGLFRIFSIILLFLFLFAAIFIALSKKLALDMAYDTKVFLQEYLLNNLNRITANDGKAITQRAISSSISNDCRSIFIALRWIFDAMTHFIVAVFCIFALIIIQAEITLILLLIFGFASLFYYAINIEIADSVDLYQKHQNDGVSKLKAKINEIKLSQENKHFIFENDLPEFFQLTRTFKNRYIGVVKTELVNYVFISIVLFIVFYILGTKAITEDFPWSFIFAYFAIIRIFFGSIKGIFNFFSKYSRVFYSVRQVQSMYAQPATSRSN